MNRHHILHTRQSWQSREEATYLRQQPLLIPKMDNEVHNELHANCPEVPLLGAYALREVANNFERGSNPIETLCKLIWSIDNASRHPKAHRIERQLARLSASALELQLPYLREGIV